MFTGIVTDIGRVREVRETDRDRRYEIETAWNTAGIDLGASISHAGCCLTVTEKGPGWFAVEVSGETLSKTKLGDWTENTRVNLERAAKLGDELGGHIVTGHVDAVGRIVAVDPGRGFVILKDDVIWRRRSNGCVGHVDLPFRTTNRPGDQWFL